MFPTVIHQQPCTDTQVPCRRITNDKDLAHFRTKSPAFKNIIDYIDLLCERILGTYDKVLSHKYVIQNPIIKRTAEFLDELERCCDTTDLKLAPEAVSLRFGHIAFRDWFDGMKELAREFVQSLKTPSNEKFINELLIYLCESFGNRMRLDYGTGHELSFLVFTMGLSSIVMMDLESLEITTENLKSFVQQHGWDILSLFSHKYLKLCRKLQTRFRLEPAGSRGVYNMDDFQYLPFLFGSAQLSGAKHIDVDEFYLAKEVDQYKNNYVFFEAVDFILRNKRGPFNEHSYTLWSLTAFGSWENIFRRIRAKFINDILSPLPITQHFLFGNYILRWNVDHDKDNGADEQVGQVKMKPDCKRSGAGA